jgi:hypothetical protein
MKTDPYTKTVSAQQTTQQIHVQYVILMGQKLLRRERNPSYKKYLTAGQEQRGLKGTTDRVMSAM